MARARTSALFSEVSGKLGEFAVIQLDSGPVVRRPPTYRRPISPGQREAMQRMQTANAIWAGFTEAEAALWNRYAAQLPPRTGFSGETFATIGYRAFIALATKFLQVHPGGTVPVQPPLEPFFTDSVAYSISAQTAKIRYVASNANRSGVVVELMLQPLANARRKPSTLYTAAGFHAFVAGALAFDVPVPPGFYACAVREVESSTGRMGPIQSLGKIEILG